MLKTRPQRRVTPLKSTKLQKKPQNKIFKTSKRRNQTLRQLTEQNNHFDAVVIGAGIAGAAAALGIVSPALANPENSPSLLQQKSLRVLGMFIVL
jgi:hypothetical protein